MAGESKKLYSPYGPVNEPKIPLLAARALAKIGRSTEAIAILADMLSVIEPTSHLSMKPDVCSLKGDLLLIDGPSQQAEAADNYRQAIVLARQNSDRIAELGATMRLAQVLRDSGRRAEARTMLAEIYGWFTEGFETVDLKEGKALLDQLTAYRISQHHSSN